MKNIKEFLSNNKEIFGFLFTEVFILLLAVGMSAFMLGVREPMNPEPLKDMSSHEFYLSLFVGILCCYNWIIYFQGYVPQKAYTAIVIPALFTLIFLSDVSFQIARVLLESRGIENPLVISVVAALGYFSLLLCQKEITKASK